MGQVETILGPVEANELGQTLMHEHVFVRSPEIEENWPTGWDEDLQKAAAIDRLRELADAGIGTIVDLTVPGLGRKVELVRQIAEQVDLHIVVATGYYTYNELPHYFDYRKAKMRGGTDILDEFFLGDIQSGIAASGVHPGILKCATDEPGLTPAVERVLRSVARVHRRTGLPISTHTHAPSKRGLDQQRVFSEEGVDLSRVVIGHSGDTTDLEYLEELLRAGSTLGMDRFGVDAYLPTAARVSTVASLCERGWASQLVLSHDASCNIDWFDLEMIRAAQPNWHFMHIVNDVIPALKEHGVSDEQITTMMVDNPRRMLDHAGGY